MGVEYKLLDRDGLKIKEGLRDGVGFREEEGGLICEF